MEVIISHFDKYPLITQKRADFELFKQAFKIVLDKKHLTKEGLCKIIAIKMSMNLGLSKELKVAFSSISPVKRPEIEDIFIHDSNWLVGFTEGEWCFYVAVQKSPTTKTGFSESLGFQLTQHCRDIKLMESLKNFWGCGKLFKRPNGEAVDFKITKFSDLTDIVIPFFQRKSLHGLKSQNFTDFCIVADIMRVKGHLTAEGLHEICKIKDGMNIERKIDT